ncbi:hypothetical protein ACFL35_09180 [Candidatus Riflebacteria bacterium]
MEQSTKKFINYLRTIEKDQGFVDRKELENTISRFKLKMNLEQLIRLIQMKNINILYIPAIDFVDPSRIFEIFRHFGWEKRSLPKKLGISLLRKIQRDGMQDNFFDFLDEEGLWQTLPPTLRKLEKERNISELLVASGSITKYNAAGRQVSTTTSPGNVILHAEKVDSGPDYHETLDLSHSSALGDALTSFAHLLALPFRTVRNIIDFFLLHPFLFLLLFLLLNSASSYLLYNGFLEYQIAREKGWPQLCSLYKRELTCLIRAKIIEFGTELKQEKIPIESLESRFRTDFTRLSCPNTGKYSYLSEPGTIFCTYHGIEEGSDK